MASLADAVASKLEEVIPVALAHYNIPGISVAIVKDGQTLAQRGFGVTDLRTKSPVTETTRFGLGSITKGFTSALVANALQHRRDITWDTPLRVILGEDFRLPDPVLTERATLRDLLAHRLGIELGETDMCLLCGPLTGEQLESRVRHMPLAADFRSKMMYNNFVYAFVGRILEKMTGASWEELLQMTFLDVLGMEGAIVIDRAAPDWTDFARPHMAGKNDELLELDLNLHKSLGYVGPCGTLAAGAKDMTSWMKFQLSRGTVDGAQIVSPGFMRECHMPQFALPRGKPEWSGYTCQPDYPVTETRDTYGMGWYLGTYRGYRLSAHGGELYGYDSLLTLFPEMNIGIFTAQNGPAGGRAYISNQLLHYIMSDLLLGLPQWLTNETLCTFPEPWQPRNTHYYPRGYTDVTKGIPPSHALADYVGTYHHAFLGDVQITENSGVLHMTFGSVGRCDLHPTGEDDDFRLEGQGATSFLHQADIYAPSDWMTVHFHREPAGQGSVKALTCALFESGPIFNKQ